MNGIHFVHAQWVHLIWVAVAIVAALAALELRGRDALGRFVSAAMQRRLATQPTLARRVARLALVLVTLVSGVVAMMRPQSVGAVETLSTSRVAADVVVLLDVSKSMLAEDASPNRLERAKAEIGELVDRLQGHRIGLVAFAGRAAVLSPLTSDYGFFRLVLRSTGIDSVSRGGTRIGDALRKGIEAFGPREGAKLILLITDGEDHDSYPLEAAREALDSGIRVAAIGFGSEDGSEITLTDPDTGARTVVTDRDGQVVRSRLDGELLREIALVTEGVYVPAGTSALDLDSIIEAHVEPLVTDSAGRRVRRVPVEHYRWFVLVALVALVAAVWVGATGGRRPVEAGT